MKKKLNTKMLTLIILLVIAAAACIASSIVVIPTGYTGVRTTFGQVDPNPVPSGLTIKMPFVQQIELVNNKQQDIVFDTKIWSETSERTAIYYADVTVTYQISPDKSAWIYGNVSNYRNTLVTQSLVASGIKSSSKTLTDTEATNRAVIEPGAMEQIQQALDDKYGQGVVIINKVVIGQADFDESYIAAIAAKQRAQLEAQQQAIENQKAIDKAEADAKVTRTKAEAAAQAKLIEAEAEAQANKVLEESLSPLILQDKYIDRWDGSMPQVLGSGNMPMMIGLDGLGQTGEAETEGQ